MNTTARWSNIRRRAFAGQDLSRKYFQGIQSFSFRTAIDYFGAGHAGLNLFSEYHPDIIKIDMELVREIDTSTPKQAIVNGIVPICAALNVRMLTEGIETRAERDFLYEAGIDLMQWD